MGKHALAGGFRRRDETGALQRRVRRIGRALGGPISASHLVLSLRLRGKECRAVGEF